MSKAQRTPIQPSIRWSVFYRDGFACRYCGAQAGEDGVELVIDHVLSVAEGGDNRIDNLVTACRPCNHRKGARSLKEVPTPQQVVDRVRERASNLQTLKDQLDAAASADDELRQRLVDLKCEAYESESVHVEPGEVDHAIRLLREFGADKVVEWYRSAVSHGVSDQRAILYVCGCARTHRKER